MRPADRDRDVLGAQRWGLGVPFAQDAEPPDEVTSAIPARGAVVGTDRQVDAPARAQQLIRDLHAGRSGSDDEHGAVGQLTADCGMRWSAAARPCLVGQNRRYPRTLERSGRRDDVARLDRPVGRLGAERRRALAATHREDLDTASDRRIDLLRVGLEVLRDLNLGGERIGVEISELQTGKAVVPCRSVGDQGVPPLGTPTLGDAMPLEDEMRQRERRSGARSSPDRPGRRRRRAPQPSAVTSSLRSRSVLSPQLESARPVTSRRKGTVSPRSSG